MTSHKKGLATKNAISVANPKKNLSLSLGGRSREHFFDFGPVAFAEDPAAGEDEAEEGPDDEGLGAAVGGLGGDGDGLDDSQHRGVPLDLKLGLLELLCHIHIDGVRNVVASLDAISLNVGTGADYALGTIANRGQRSLKGFSFLLGFLIAALNVVEVALRLFGAETCDLGL